MFREIAKNIYKIDIPFDNITTSSFLVVSDNGNILVDNGTYPSDVTNHILPALNFLNVKPDYLFLTHSHADHSGGTKTLFEAYKNLKLICFNKEICNEFDGRLLKNGDEVIKDICFLSLMGHSADSGALFDKRSLSIITGDSIQLWGITKYGCGVGAPLEYKKTLERLKNMKIENLFASHEYYPLGSMAKGKKAVIEYINEAERFYNELIDFVKSQKQNSILSEKEITCLFMEYKRKSHPNMPIIPEFAVKSIIKVLNM